MSLPDRHSTGRDAPASPLRTPQAAAAFTRVRERLKASEAVDELAQLDGLSPDEMRLLVKMERGWGPHVPQNPHTDHDLLYPQENSGFSTGNTQGCSPSPTQAIGGPVGVMDYTRVIPGAGL